MYVRDRGINYATVYTISYLDLTRHFITYQMCI